MFFSWPNVQDEPRPWLARAVLLGARIVTAMVVGSGVLLARFMEPCLVVFLPLPLEDRYRGTIDDDIPNHSAIDRFYEPLENLSEPDNDLTSI
jgi:hypothetical protein